MVTTDIPDGHPQCFPGIESDRTLTRAKGTYSANGEHSNRVHSILVGVPFNGDENIVGNSWRRLQWTDFLYNGSGRSEDWNQSPVVGMYCSGRSCTTKRLLKARESACNTQTSTITTDWFSEEYGRL